jgi:hypothetical protein
MLRLWVAVPELTVPSLAQLVSRDVATSSEASSSGDWVSTITQTGSLWSDHVTRIVQLVVADGMINVVDSIGLVANECHFQSHRHGRNVFLGTSYGSS